ncbi:P-loop containing nucleoside triphosphate hydrolase protein [Dichomitus squalens]|nr:P-loop containing nucleoside triphosphate hydrolase protein [Dichomitus squalens]
MAASLWSKSLGIGLFAAAGSCRSSASTLGLHALRAGRLSAIRYSSHIKPPIRNALPSQEHPHEVSEPTGIAAETRPTPNADQPKFIALKDAIHSKTLQALTGDPFNLVHMSSVQAAVLPLLPDLVRPYNSDETDAPPRDLMVKARTGTGKTLAFLVPAVEARLNALEAHAKQAEQAYMKKSTTVNNRIVDEYARRHVGALIISPTRELATQIANEAIKLTKHMKGFEVKLFTGGLSKDKQRRGWEGRRDLVVATPGRLRDFIETERGFADALRTTEMFILDEADTLLEMGFIPEITAIAEHLKPSPERQTFMFSATMSDAIRKVARNSLSEKHRFINCVPDDAPPTHHAIPQYYTVVPKAEEQLPHVLRLIAEDQLANPGKSKVLVFLPTTRLVQLYSTIMTQIGPSVLPAGPQTRFAEMHAKKTMDRRVKTSDWFRVDNSGSTVMLTSDVSARGVDYPGVTRVIQVSIPSSGDIYVHRVGRTGRGSNMSGRADIVLLPHEAGFLETELAGVPMKEITTKELSARVDELVKKYEEDPSAVFPDAARTTSRNRFPARTSRQGFPNGVSDRLAAIEESVHGLQADINTEDVTDAMMTMLAFYASNSDYCRTNKSPTLAGVQAWADALTGSHVALRIPREWRERGPVRQHSRGGASSRKPFGLKERRDPGEFKRTDSRSYDWKNDISGGRRERRGSRDDRGPRENNRWRDDRGSRQDRGSRGDSWSAEDRESRGNRQPHWIGRGRVASE